MICSYLSGIIWIVRKNGTKDAVMVCICIITHTIFFIIIAPVSHYRGTPRFWDSEFPGVGAWGLFFFGMMGTACGAAVCTVRGGSFRRVILSV